MCADKKVLKCTKCGKKSAHPPYHAQNGDKEMGLHSPCGMWRDEIFRLKICCKNCYEQNVTGKILCKKILCTKCGQRARQWMEEKRHCALKMMVSAPLASGTQYAANTNTRLQIQIQIQKIVLTYASKKTDKKDQI